jgi:hypothetical protein
MTKPQLIKLTEEIEDLVCKKMQIWEYEKNMPKIVKILANRYIEPELDLEIKGK